MAGQRLTDKTALAEQTGSGDLYMVVDVNDTTGSSAGTSKSIDSKFVIQTDKLSLSNAEVLDLENTPKTLVGALSGYMPTVYNVTVLVTYAAPAETGRKNLTFGFDESSDDDYWGIVVDIMDSQSSDVSYVVQAQVLPGRKTTCTSTLLNKPFKVWAEDTGFVGGWSCDIYVTYSHTKIL